MTKRTAAALALLVAGCEKAPRAPPPEPDAGAPSLPPSASAASASADTPKGVEREARMPAEPPAANLPPAAREAERITVRRLADERGLARQEGLLHAHFGSSLPSPLEAQTVPLPGDRRAWLTYGEPRRREPFLFVTDAKSELLWTKELPLAGTRQIVTEMVLAPGPQGEVVLLWCDIPTQIVGLRKWAADGTVLADFEVLEVDVCEALSALYWPGRGWIAVASQHGAARAQLLDERGARSFGPKGIELAWTARPSAPASIAVDSGSSAIVLQVGDLPLKADRILAMRYDAHGARLWERPLDLGQAAPAGNPPGHQGFGGGRIATAVVEPGKVRVTLGPRVAVTLTSLGSILATADASARRTP
jgi:hypothetical protein